LEEWEEKRGGTTSKSGLRLVGVISRGSRGSSLASVYEYLLDSYVLCPYWHRAIVYLPVMKSSKDLVTYSLVYRQAIRLDEVHFFS